MGRKRKSTVLLDPFARPQPLLSADVPLSLLMFVTFMAGLVVGGLVVWFGQGKWRRTARTSRREVHLWRSEADRLANERDKSASGSGAQMSVSAPNGDGSRGSASNSNSRNASMGRQRF